MSISSLVGAGSRIDLRLPFRMLRFLLQVLPVLLVLQEELVR